MGVTTISKGLYDRMSDSRQPAHDRSRADRLSQVVSATGLLVAFLVPLFLGSPLTADNLEARQSQALPALLRSLNWLSQHPPDPGQDVLGELGLDAVAWYLFAEFHPDPEVRREAGVELDARLTSLPILKDEIGFVALSYLSVLIRLVDLRGLESPNYRTQIEQADLATILNQAQPTTRFWMAELLNRSNFDITPDFSETFIAQEATRFGLGLPPEGDYTTREAYLVFHELVPATDLGRLPLSLTQNERSFLKTTIPELIEISRVSGDLDALAEILVASALSGTTDSEAYRDGLAVLLASQRPDGTYSSHRDRGRPGRVTDYRHIVQVASWALLSSLTDLNEFEPKDVKEAVPP